MTFSIKTDRFEGPLDLLLELIEKRKLLVNDVSIAQVTDDYLSYVAALEANSLADTTRFISLASTLLLIKSKSLLPVFEMTHDEEESVSELEERLRVYKIYRDAGRVLAGRFGKTVLAPRPYARMQESIFMPDAYATKSALRDAIGRVLTRLPEQSVTPKVTVKKTISLEEMIDSLRARMKRQMKLSFREGIGKDADPVTVIVGFLAVLELIRHGQIEAKQDGRFADIEIRRGDKVETPNYS